MKKPIAIIFDFDDTLVDSKPIIDKALAGTMAKFNIPANFIDHKNIDKNRSLRNYFHEIFGANVYSARDTYYELYTEYAKNLIALEKAEEVLKFLKSTNVHMSIVSNKNGTRLRDEVKNKFGWNNYFSKVVGSGDATEDKPSIKPALLALQDLKISNYNECLVIGDSSIDLELAKNLGSQAILFGNANIEAKIRVCNHEELLKTLQNIF